MKLASLFSGIGGFEAGFLRADPSTEIVFASEIDKYARAIYRKQIGVEPHGDIKEINAADVPDHDILVGGFPCQDVSIAGKREGLCGTRSGLFYEIIRILREKQPVLVLLENVKGLLSSNTGWDFARILIELESAGYECEWQILDSAAFVPQRRERVFIVGHLRSSGECTEKIFPLRKDGGLVEKEKSIVYTIDANYYKGPAKQSRTMILCDSGPGRNIQIRKEIIPPIRANAGAGYNNVVCHPETDDIIVKCITGGGHSGGLHSDMTTLKCNNRIRRLMPIEVERLQGFPDQWTAEGIDDNGNIIQISDTQRYKCLGNAATIPVIEFIAIHILKIMAERGALK